MKLFCLFLLAMTAVMPAFPQKSETTTIKVFFHPDKLDPEWMDCQKVAPVKRTIPKTTATATAALLELFKGPSEAEKKEFTGFGPPETNGILKSVRVRGGGAYVNFTKAVYEQMGTATTSCGGGFFSMIEATLLQFPTIKKVYYAVEGDTNGFYEWVQVGECPHGKRHCAASNFIN
jgi:spore germination protein GerM